MIRAVVFDYGTVLATGEAIYSEPARLLGVPAEDVEALYWHGRRAYDEGGPDAAYWTPILTGLGKPAALETIQQLAALDARLWLDVRPEALRNVLDVREAGRLVAVLSNAPFALDLALADAPFADVADYWFVSASMGVTKPHPAAYHRVTEVLEVAPHEIAFVDDRQHNVEGAQAHGWVAHLWQSDADTRSWLRSLGVLEG